MNEADPSPINLDELRMLPDWLREEAPPPAKQYAGHDYPQGDGGPNRRGDRSFGGFDSRGGGQRDRRGAGGPPDRRREGGRPGGPPPRGGGGNRGPREDHRGVPAPAPAPAMPAPVRVEFLPDDRCLASINKQIRTTHLAYPLFGLARMFLQEPARHFVQFSVLPEAPEGTKLYQLGEDGIITLDRGILEKQAFDASKDQFYLEETVQKEPLKGNFTNVARERLSGTLLGPTNYHGYQPALRSLYDTRYSRRMSFDDFRRNIEVSSDPALVEKWKEEARTTTTTSTRVPEGETPTVLSSATEARTHFRQHHLESLVHSGTSFKVHGSVARNLPEHPLMQAIREAHDRELRYPAQFVQLLRQGLQSSGLHIFKHRKRVVYVSLARPTPFVAQGTVSPGVAAILESITQFPLCTRKVLADKVIAREAVPPAAPSTSVPTAAVPARPALESRVAEVEPLESSPDVSAAAPEPSPDAQTEPATEPNLESSPVTALSAEPIPVPEPPAAPATLPDDPTAKAKAALAADLRFLVQSGHIIEFHNGTFDLPLPPKDKEDAPNPGSNEGKSNRGNQTGKGASGRKPEAIFRLGQTQPEAETPVVPHGAGPERGSAEPLEPADKPDASLIESIEAASAALTTEASPADNPDAVGLTVEDVVIEPGSVVTVEVSDVTADKTNQDGLISGPGAAPLDLPIPGDAEDAPATRL